MEYIKMVNKLLLMMQKVSKMNQEFLDVMDVSLSEENRIILLKNILIQSEVTMLELHEMLDNLEKETKSKNELRIETQGTTYSLYLN